MSSGASSTDFVRVIRIKSANGSEKMLEVPAKLDLERPKRPRTVFTDEQLEKLEQFFNTSGYLSGTTRAKLAKSLGLSDNQVKVWFQNRRTKQKKIESREQVKSNHFKNIEELGTKPDYQMGQNIQNFYHTYQNYWTATTAAFLSNNVISS